MEKLSFEEIREAVRLALSAANGSKDCWITQLFAGKVIFEVWAGVSDSKRKLYSQSYSIDDDGKVALEDDKTEVQEHRSYVPVKAATFSLTQGVEEGGFTTYSGPIFELGTYRDKDFSLNKEEADAKTVAAFTPVPNDLEHRETILSGELGDLSGVRRVGNWLHGDVRLPNWLRKVVGDELQVSVSFDKATKRIIGNALTVNPRITNAKVVAAFNKSRTGENVSKPNFLKRLFGILGSADFSDADLDELEREAAKGGGGSGADSAAFTALQSDRDALAGRLKAVEDRKAKDLAVEFADKAIADRKAYPSEREDMIAAFTQALADDNAGAAMFSESGEAQEGERVARLRGIYEKRLPHTLTKEKLAEFSVIGANGGDVPKEPTINSADIYARLNGQGGK